MQETVKDQVREGVLRSFRRLMSEDGYLFDCPIEEHFPDYDARKLHEVCLNHRLANQLAEEIIPVIRGGEAIFVDIEFNREGVDFKNLRIAGQEKIVRPDIIIHNRKTGTEKLNFLVVECKKEDTPPEKIKEDRQKIHALMEDEKYEYRFGLQVVYGKGRVKGTLFFKRGQRIESEAVDCGF